MSRRSNKVRFVCTEAMLRVSSSRSKRPDALDRARYSLFFLQRQSKWKKSLMKEVLTKAACETASSKLCTSVDESESILRSRLRRLCKSVLSLEGRGSFETSYFRVRRLCRLRLRVGVYFAVSDEYIKAL